MSTPDAPSFPLAPSEALNDLPTPKPEASRNSSAATVTVIGCGGGGINIVRMLDPDVSRLADIRRLDTSDSNIRAGESLKIVTGGFGSGGLRGTNAPRIVNEVARLSDDDIGNSNVTVVCFALNGGSGSVLGPILVGELARKKRQVVAVVVASVASEKYVTNTRNTLQSLTNIVDMNDLYLPTMFFENVGEPGHVDVTNEVVRRRLNDLVRILTLPTTEVDRNDRLNWLNGKATLSAKAGLYPMFIAAGTNTDIKPQADKGELFEFDDGMVVDSALSLGVRAHENDRPTYLSIPGMAPRFFKAGILDGHSRYAMLGIISHDDTPLAKLITKMDDAEKAWSTHSTERSAAASLRTAKSNVGKSGLVV